MDILRGSLDGIARPASVSRSRPGSRISSSQSMDKSAEKLKLNSTVGSFEVLTPEPCVLELPSDQRWWLNMSPDKLRSPDVQEPEDTEMQTPSGRLTMAESSQRADDSQSPQLNEEETDILLCNDVYEGEIRDSEDDEMSQTATERDDEADFVGSQDPTEEITDPKLVKAIRKMKTLDEILLKKFAKEKEVKAQGIEIRKQLWEELQRVTMETSGQSHEESVNTNKFLALTPQLDEAEVSFQIEKVFSPLFPTQLPMEENEPDVQEAIQGKHSDTVMRDILNESERSSNRANNAKGKNQKKGLDFIHRNIMLAKDAGSHVLLMDDEKLRLEQLLGDIQDDSSDEEASEDASRWIVPGDGYTPEPGEYDQLAKIEAELLIVQSTKDFLEDSYSGISSPKEAFQEASVSKIGNVAAAPGEKVLRYTKELREETLRLKEIDQQLEDIDRRSVNSTRLTSARYSAWSPEISVNFGTSVGQETEEPGTLKIQENYTATHETNLQFLINTEGHQYSWFPRQVTSIFQLT
ncbi:fibrous sheath-interacting protein 1 [Discoglossus pictus]